MAATTATRSLPATRTTPSTARTATTRSRSAPVTTRPGAAMAATSSLARSASISFAARPATTRSTRSMASPTRPPIAVRGATGCSTTRLTRSPTAASRSSSRLGNPYGGSIDDATPVGGPRAVLAPHAVDPEVRQSGLDVHRERRRARDLVRRDRVWLERGHQRLATAHGSLERDRRASLVGEAQDREWVLAARVLGLVVAAGGQCSHAWHAHERNGREVGIVRDRDRLHERLARALHDAGEEPGRDLALRAPAGGGGDEPAGGAACRRARPDGALAVHGARVARIADCRDGRARHGEN